MFYLSITLKAATVKVFFTMVWDLHLQDRSRKSRGFCFLSRALGEVTVTTYMYDKRLVQDKIEPGTFQSGRERANH